MAQTTLAQQMAAINSTKVALNDAFYRAAEAFNSGAMVAQRMYEVTGPIKRAVEAASASLGDSFDYGIDRATYTDLTTWTDTIQAAFAKAEAELLEAKQHLRSLKALMGSGSSSDEKTRLSGVIESAEKNMNELWDLTKSRQEGIKLVQQLWGAPKGWSDGSDFF